MKITLKIIEEEESKSWGDNCPICDTVGWDILEKLITSATNCFISNKIKNMNSIQRLHTENTRELKKLKST